MAYRNLTLEMDGRVAILTVSRPEVRNALDTASYLVDGALPFATGADADRPRVSDSSPAEAQVNVSVRTDQIVVVFDEPMDTSVTTARLVSAAGEATLSGTWTDGGTRLVLISRGRLAVDSAHALDLGAMRDARGNALDEVPQLRDGQLDFVTGADARPSVALYAIPGEGATEVSHETDTILIVFDQAMDRTASSVRIDDGVAPFDAPISWNLAGTQLRAIVAGDAEPSWAEVSGLYEWLRDEARKAAA